MKKQAVASTILVSLSALAGCNSGDNNYVAYKKTTPTEFESNQNPQVQLKADAAKRDAQTSVPAEPDSLMPDTSGDAIALKDAANVKPASHSANSGAENSGNPALQEPDGPSSDLNSIVSSQTGLTGRADTPEIDNGAVGSQNKIELLVPEKSFRRERGTEAVRISYDDIDLLKILNMEPVPPNAVEYFPEWLSSLNGKQVRIRGWMYPTFVSEGLTSFTLARDNGICCFQRMPKIYDVIFVQLQKGKSSNYISARPFDVEGTFRIDNEGDGSELPRLYRIENASVLD